MTLHFHTMSNPAGAISYFKELDYHFEGSEVSAYTLGKGAGMLGINASPEHFKALIENRNPLTGEAMTSAKREDRDFARDMTVSIPKSVTLAATLGDDERIEPAVERALARMFSVMERDAQARVRKGGADYNRTTGNLTAFVFPHQTSRPIGGQPDPQLHWHVVILNQTYDAVEKQWKAVQFQPLLKDSGYYNAIFRNEMANELQAIGYGIRKTKDAFEVDGISDATAKKFSRRTAQIEQLAEALGVTDADTKAALGAKSREGKTKGLSWDDLLRLWKERLTDKEQAEISAARGEAIARESTNIEALKYGLEHTLERNSVVRERDVVTAALKQGMGSVQLDELYSELGKMKGVIRRNIDGVEMVSTKGVLDEEKQLVQFAVKGRGRFKPLSPRPQGQLDIATLSQSQQAAIKHVWTSPDRLILIRGAAGTGKTTLTKAALEGINKPWVILAPSSEASRGVLRRDGFENADTLAKFLTDQEMQASVKGGLIWLDEASLAGSHDVAKLVQLAEQLNARVVLSGDKQQHKSVARGDILTLLEKRAGLPAVEVSEIKRQSGEYKAAVAALAKGHTGAGFDKLDALGWIKEGGLVDDYMKAVNAGKSVLVISPTHAEGDKVTTAIRDKLKEAGKLGEGQLVKQLKPLNLTKAELKELKKHPQEGVLTNKFAAFREGELELAKGDVVRVTSNGTDITGKHRLNNGAMYQVAGFTKAGIKLSNGWTVGKDFGHLAHGYVVTSHASQGKTVDVALIAMGNESLTAMSAAQFYVSASRARHQTMVYVDDKEAVRDAIRRDDNRMLASDLVRRERKGIKDRLKLHQAFIRRVFSHITNRERDYAYER